jgi:hypothetical protein
MIGHQGATSNSTSASWYDHAASSEQIIATLPFTAPVYRGTNGSPLNHAFSLARKLSPVPPTNPAIHTFQSLVVPVTVGVVVTASFRGRRDDVPALPRRDETRRDRQCVRSDRKDGAVGHGCRFEGFVLPGEAQPGSSLLRGVNDPTLNGPQMQISERLPWHRAQGVHVAQCFHADPI